MKKHSIILIAFAAFASIFTSCSNSGGVKFFPFADEDKERWGIVDADGEIIVEREWKSEPSLPSQGITYVKNKQGLYEFFTVEEKPEQIGEEYVSVTSFKEDLAVAVEPDQPISYINKKGEIAFTLEKNIVQAGIFNEGLARFEDNKGKWGYIDLDGKIVIEAEYDNAYPFSEGLACVVEKKGKDDDAKFTYSFISRSGDIAFTLDKGVECYATFSEGLVPVSDEGEFGYVNKTGEYIIKPEKDRDFAGNFKDGYAIVGEDGEYGVIDKDNKTIIRTKHTGEISYLMNGLAPIEDDEEYGFINLEEDEVIKPKYDKVLPFFNDLTIVKDRDYIFINKEGEQVTETELEYVPIFSITKQYYGKLYEIAQSDFLDLEAISKALVKDIHIKNDSIISAFDIDKTLGVDTIIKTFKISTDDISSYAEEFKLIKDKKYTDEIDANIYINFTDDCKKPIRKLVGDYWYSYYETTGYEINDESFAKQIEFFISCKGKAEEKKDKIIKALETELVAKGFKSENKISADETEVTEEEDYPYGSSNSSEVYEFTYKGKKSVTLEISSYGTILMKVFL